MVAATIVNSLSREWALSRKQQLLARLNNDEAEAQTLQDRLKRSG
jgi:hypothetical protein